jgi:hypothetical protein
MAGEVSFFELGVKDPGPAEEVEQAASLTARLHPSPRC